MVLLVIKTVIIINRFFDRIVHLKRNVSRQGTEY